MPVTGFGRLRHSGVFEHPLRPEPVLDRQPFSFPQRVAHGDVPLRTSEMLDPTDPPEDTRSVMGSFDRFLVAPLLTQHHAQIPVGRCLTRSVPECPVLVDQSLEDAPGPSEITNGHVAYRDIVTQIHQPDLIAQAAIKTQPGRPVRAGFRQIGFDQGRTALVAPHELSPNGNGEQSVRLGRLPGQVVGFRQCKRL